MTSNNPLRLAALTSLTMVAFAANSLLNRVAVASDWIDPMSFGAVRLVAGAVTLAALALWRTGTLPLGRARIWGALTLLLYIVGFSLAYVRLDAGLGALVLFGTVQLTMFAGGLIGGERPSLPRWLGTFVALIGLVWLMWPQENITLSVPHLLCMVSAGIGWGVFSLIGRGTSNPLQASAASFVMAAPLAVGLAFALPNLASPSMTGTGIALACVSGAMTSGLGYALWYSLLPKLTASVAAVSQLTVPAIATLGGILLLGETITLRFALASLLILGGVAIAVLTPRRAEVSGQ